MLDSYVIDAIRQAEQHRREAERPRLEIPLEPPAGAAHRHDTDPHRPDSEVEDDERGIHIIPLGPTVPLRDASSR